MSRHSLSYHGFDMPQLARMNNGLKSCIRWNDGTINARARFLHFINTRLNLRTQSMVASKNFMYKYLIERAAPRYVATLHDVGIRFVKPLNLISKFFISINLC